MIARALPRKQLPKEVTSSMVSQSLYGRLEQSVREPPNKELTGKSSSYKSKLRKKPRVALIPEKTSDLVSITTFSVSPRYIYLSPSHKRILGYDPSDLLNKCPFDLIHPDDVPKLFPILQKYLASLSQSKDLPDELKLPTERLQYRIIDKCGQWHFIESTGDLLADDLILFISRDVTERVKTETDLFESCLALQTNVEERTRELTTANEALHNSERKYRDILESIEDGYYEVDLAGNMTFFNSALCRITGYSPGELLGMNNRDYTDPETARRMFEIFNRVYRTGEPSKIDDYLVIKKDGTKCTVELSTSLITGPAGNPIGFRGIARDITKRRSIEKALEESEEKYRTILQSIEDGYYEVDLAGNMVFFNDSMCRLIGYSSEELKGMNNRSYMAEETAKAVYQTFNQVYRTGEGTKALGWELLRKNGEKRYVETSVSLVRDRKEEPIGFRGIARDITEQKSLEKAKERIINHLSHELATPLSVIEAAAAIIERAVEKGDLGKIRKWAEKSRAHICRLRNLQAQVSDILNSRPVEENERSLHFIEAALNQLEELKEEPLKESAEAVRQSIVRQLKALYTMEGVGNEVILMDGFLDEVCAEAILSMRERQIEIIREFVQGISLQMDKTALKKICGGFLRNAIENTPDEGRIEIRLKQEREYVRIDFQDFGVGITPENQKWIFGGFFHTQDTQNYASKKPYSFNAGGAGADLLRAKVLSEKLNLRLEFSSARCRYLRSDEAECPGRISLCPFVKGRQHCLSSGESLFSLLLPINSAQPRPVETGS
jgi:PAS domain S-box-containing protein